MDPGSRLNLHQHATSKLQKRGAGSSTSRRSPVQLAVSRCAPRNWGRPRPRKTVAIPGTRSLLRFNVGTWESGLAARISVQCAAVLCAPKSGTCLGPGGTSVPRTCSTSRSPTGTSWQGPGPFHSSCWPRLDAPSQRLRAIGQCNVLPENRSRRQQVAQPAMAGTMGMRRCDERHPAVPGLPTTCEVPKEARHVPDMSRPVQQSGVGRRKNGQLVW